MEEASSPRRFRFSLRQLGVLVVFLGMAIALVMQYRELASLRVEVRKLREEAGYLNVEDPEKFYAVEIEKFEELTWSWKVYIPARGSYVLYTKRHDIPVDPSQAIQGLPQIVDGSMTYEEGGLAFALPPGEISITAAIRRQQDGDFALHVSAGGHGVTTLFPSDSSLWPDKRDNFSESLVGRRDQPPDAQLVLLLLEDNKGVTVPNGFKVWIERVAK